MRLLRYFYPFIRKSYSHPRYIPHRAMTAPVDLSDVRKKYESRDAPFLEKDLPAKEPFGVFEHWFNRAKATVPSDYEINAMCISTATKTGVPSSRMVLLKAYSAQGFSFYTNYDSRKGKELAENNYISILFYWPWLNQQVRIEGIAEKLPSGDADSYWVRRPKASQASAAISEQSQAIDSRETLEKRTEELNGKDIPRPNTWGGYNVVPSVFEFWVGQSDRLHDRIVFQRADQSGATQRATTHTGDNGWAYERIQP